MPGQIFTMSNALKRLALGSVLAVDAINHWVTCPISQPQKPGSAFAVLFPK